MWSKRSQTSYQLGKVQEVVHNERMVVATELPNCEITCHQHSNEARTLCHCMRTELPDVSVAGHCRSRTLSDNLIPAPHRPLHLRSPTDIAHVIMGILRHSDLNAARQEIYNL